MWWLCPLGPSVLPAEGDFLALEQGNENHVHLFVYARSKLGVSNDMCWLAMLHVAKVLVVLALLHYYWYLYYDHCPHC